MRLQWPPFLCQHPLRFCVNIHSISVSTPTPFLCQHPHHGKTLQSLHICVNTNFIPVSTPTPFLCQHPLHSCANTHIIKKQFSRLPCCGRKGRSGFLLVLFMMRRCPERRPSRVNTATNMTRHCPERPSRVNTALTSRPTAQSADGRRGQ